MVRSRYNMFFSSISKYVTIMDLNGMVSVTNDIEQVVDDLKSLGIDVDAYRIVYRNEEGRWNFVFCRGGKWMGFLFVNANSREEALEFMSCGSLHSDSPVARLSQS